MCKYRPRDPIQTVHEEILIYRSHTNCSRGNVSFPVVSRFRAALKPRGDINSPNPVQTETAGKNASAGIIPASSARTNDATSARTYRVRII